MSSKKGYAGKGRRTNPSRKDRSERQWHNTDRCFTSSSVAIHGENDDELSKGILTGNVSDIATAADDDGDSDSCNETDGISDEHISIKKLTANVCMWEFSQNDSKRDSGSKLCRLGYASKLRIGQSFPGIVLSSEATTLVNVVLILYYTVDVDDVGVVIITPPYDILFYTNP